MGQYAGYDHGMCNNFTRSDNARVAKRRIRRKMNIGTRKFFLALWLGLFCQSGSTSVFGDLYKVQVEVTTRDAKTLELAFQEAMATVLIRVTGNGQPAQHEEFDSLLTHARDYIQQYGYVDRRTLSISFDGLAVNSRLRELGQPIWGQERPDTIVWLALTGANGRRSILPADSPGVALESLKSRARRRGIPIIFPLMDAEDQNSIRVSDLRGAFEDKIFSASERYDADAILVGTARLARGSNDANPVYLAAWTLFFAGEEQSWRGGLEAGIDQAADQFAAMLAAVDSRDSNRHLLLVQGVDNLTAYGHVNQYLESLSLVTSVAVDRVQGQEILFSLELRAGRDRLVSAIKLGKVLFPDDGDFPLLQPGTMVYRYGR